MRSRIQPNTDEADTIRHQVTNILCTSKPPKGNLHKGEQKALQVLNNNSSIIILPADKGNATVVMDRKDYETKLTDLLQDSTYKPINMDPTTYLEKITKKKIITSNMSKEIQ
uniref:Uncharacterized protein n=1 Tax=Micrurus lemniscatus lemniscatus TaxID=129467 RepID=A0A2D4IM57_MICLE